MTTVKSELHNKSSIFTKELAHTYLLTYLFAKPDGNASELKSTSNSHKVEEANNDLSKQDKESQGA